MNIALFTDKYLPNDSGIAVSTHLLANVLRAHGHNVLIVAPTIGDEKSSKKDSVLLTFKVRKKRNIIQTVGLYRRSIYKMVKKFNPDVIHNMTNGPIGELGRYTSNKLKLPLVFTYNTHYEEYAPYVGKGLMKRIMRSYERKHLRHISNASTELIAPSNKIKKYLRYKGMDKYINVIPTGVDESFFLEDEISEQNIKRLTTKYNIKEDEKIILYVGRLSKEKNVDMIIKGFAKFIEGKKEKYRLFILGTGSELEALKTMVKQIEEEDHVEFIGALEHDKVKPYYLIADLCVHASTNETQNMTLIESVLSHRMMLTIDDESVAMENEDEKICFTYTSEDDFVKQMEMIFSLGEKEQKLIKEQAYQAVKEHYGVETFYEKTMEVYERAKRKSW